MTKFASFRIQKIPSLPTTLPKCYWAEDLMEDLIIMHIDEIIGTLLSPFVGVKTHMIVNIYDRKR